MQALHHKGGISCLIDKELSFHLWQELRFLRLDLGRQPRQVREAVIDYEERLLFSLIDDGTLEDVLRLIRMNCWTMEAILSQTREGCEER